MCRQQQCLFLLGLVTVSICSGSRVNSKRLEWQDRSNSKRLRWDNEDELSNSPFQRTKGERGLTFINNEAYSLSRKHQKMMWDLYLRKGYAPSIADYDEEYPYADLSPSSSGYRAGTATLIDQSLDTLYPTGENVIADYGLKKNPDVIASRILDNYELTKSSRGVPDVQNEMTSNLIAMRSTFGPTFGKTERTPVEDKVTSGPMVSITSIFSYLWDSLKDNIGELLGREMQETILNTLWSWWSSIVEFVNARGKRAVAGRQSHTLTFT